MGTDRIVVLSPSLDQHLRLLQSVEDFHVQKFVSELAIEALVVAVLPGTAGLDVERLDTEPGASPWSPLYRSPAQLPFPEAP